MPDQDSWPVLPLQENQNPAIAYRGYWAASTLMAAMTGASRASRREQSRKDDLAVERSAHALRCDKPRVCANVAC